MTDRQIEQQLKRAMDHAAPNDFAGVLSRCGDQKGSVTSMTPQKKKFRAAPYLAAACLALIVFGGGLWMRQVNTVASLISLDVNPSIEMRVNAGEKVLTVTALNADGQTILEGMDLEGTQATVAMNAIIGSLLQHGYVDELANSILITVEDEDAQRGERLQQELTAQADAALTNAQVNGAILSMTLQYSDELNAKAAEYGISAGKAALIQAIVVGSNNTKTFESLVGLTINELNLLYSSQTTQGTGDSAGEVIDGADTPTGIPVTGGIQASGSASQSAYIGLEAGKAAALSHAGLTADQVTFLEVEYDYDDGRMVYEVEFHCNGQKYEYEIDALTAQVVKAETEYSGTQSGGNTSAAGYIGESAAKAAALSHAGVAESATTYCNVWLEYDDGRAECYEVEFMAGSTRYEYEIALTSATVIKYETKALSGGQQTNPSGGQQTNPSGSDIGSEAAKAAALRDAGLSESAVTGMKVERDYDDGRVEYDVEFRSGGVEYEYVVDGATGAILEKDTDGSPTSSTSGDIGAEAAKSAAFAHAGVSASAVYNLELDRDYDDGRLEYELEFKAGGMEYEYTIDGATGNILQYESDWD